MSKRSHGDAASPGVSEDASVQMNKRDKKENEHGTLLAHKLGSMKRPAEYAFEILRRNDVSLKLVGTVNELDNLVTLRGQARAAEGACLFMDVHHLQNLNGEISVLKEPIQIDNAQNGSEMAEDEGELEETATGGFKESQILVIKEEAAVNEESPLIICLNGYKIEHNQSTKLENLVAEPSGGITFDAWNSEPKVDNVRFWFGKGRIAFEFVSQEKVGYLQITPPKDKKTADISWTKSDRGLTIICA